MPLERLPRSTPETKGLSSRAVLDLLDGFEKTVHELHSLMIVVRGHVVTEGWWAPYAADLPHQMYSLSKSFTSTAVGLAEGEGLLSVDDLVLPYFPDDAPPEPGEHLRVLRIRDLLTMRTGHDQDPTESVFSQPDWVKAFLARPIEHQPGSHFAYNTAGSYMLSAIVQKVTGQRVVDYLAPRLFEPLGIEGAVWEESPQRINIGGTGLNLRTEDVACFGQLLLDDGVWEGRRLLPEGWVARATSRQGPSDEEPSDWAQGYGYQFWQARHGYRGDGAFGQYCVVLPEQQTVVAITAGVMDMQIPLDQLWEHLLPALTGSPLPADDAAHEELTGRTRALEVAAPVGSIDLAGVDALVGSTFAVEPNDLGISAVHVDRKSDGLRVAVTGAVGTTAIEAGDGTWLAGSVPARRWGRLPSVAMGTWTEPGTYLLTIRMITTPYALRVTARIDGDELRIVADLNVSFGQTRVAELVAHRTTT
ncbi:MAG TPA: serine hydrolase [Propionicimonas sp.]|jgi:CubicO group peptidase (beta-lactamase class C family)